MKIPSKQKLHSRQNYFQHGLYFRRKLRLDMADNTEFEEKCLNDFTTTVPMSLNSAESVPHFKKSVLLVLDKFLDARQAR